MRTENKSVLLFIFFLNMKQGNKQNLTLKDKETQQSNFCFSIYLTVSPAILSAKVRVSLRLTFWHCVMKLTTDFISLFFLYYLSCN